MLFSVLLWYTDSDYTLGIFWPSFLLWYTDSDYTLVIFWPLCCLFSYELWILITPLVSFGHCVCSSMIYRFWLHLWYLLVISSSMIYRFWLHHWCLSAIVLSVLLWFRDCDYPLGIFWPLCCLFFYDIQILIIPLVSFGHCAVCSSMIYRFSLPPWYLLAIVLSDLLWYTDSDYPLVSFGHCVVCSSMIYRFSLPPWYLSAIVLSVLLWYTDSDYPLGIFWPLCCLFFYDLGILITHLVSFGHCVVCSFMGYGFWLPLWYLLAICSSIIFRFWLHPWYLLAICSSMIYRFWLPLGIFWPLYCLFFYDLQILNTPLVSFGHLFFYDIQILITPLVSFGHCVVCSSMIYRFWLHPWYLLAIVLSVLLWFTDSGYPLGIFWPLCCLFFYDLRILIIPWDLLAIVFIEEQTTQWPKDTKGVTRICKS